MIISLSIENLPNKNKFVVFRVNYSFKKNFIIFIHFLIVYFSLKQNLIIFTHKLLAISFILQINIYKNFQ